MADFLTLDELRPHQSGKRQNLLRAFVRNHASDPYCKSVHDDVMKRSRDISEVEEQVLIRIADDNGWRL